MTDPTMQAVLRLRDLLPRRLDGSGRRHHQIAHLMALIPEGDDALALRLGRAVLAAVQADDAESPYFDPSGEDVCIDGHVRLDPALGADLVAWDNARREAQA